MKENAVYKTPEGETRKILMFDELNKMVYITIKGSNHQWVHESEYSKWVVNDTAEMPKIYVPDIPAQMMEEQPDSDNLSLYTNEEQPVKPKRKNIKK